ncbi:energy-coupling factor transporter transmembrane component T family protein [Pseudochelatococcus sp. G4_1912]|uniref:energy-coupling factor transporter transmembrane component T family protein n=1 Tax=Pseudochelatococcus sp. G4_1912 TaxID=3114288 RepID=UPI0039C683CA
MLTLTSPHKTWLHAVPAGAKLAALAVATLVLMPMSDPWAIAIGVAATLMLYGMQGWAFGIYGLRMLRPLVPFFVVLIVWHGWTGGFTREGMWPGAAIGFKMLTAVALANLVTMTTRLDAMIAVVETCTRPLARFGLSPRVLALAIALVIRFTPTLMMRSAQLAESWRARSVRRPNWRIVVPVTLAAVDDAEQIAQALRARGGL